MRRLICGAAALVLIFRHGARRSGGATELYGHFQSAAGAQTVYV